MPPLRVFPVQGSGAGRNSSIGCQPKPVPVGRRFNSDAGEGIGRNPQWKTARPAFVRALRTEFRVDIQAGTGLGDKTHEIAYVLIHHAAAFGKLPVNLPADLKTLEAAAAAERDSDAGKIKDNALNGGYGDQIPKEAKAVQPKAVQAPAKP